MSSTNRNRLITGVSFATIGLLATGCDTIVTLSHGPMSDAGSRPDAQPDVPRDTGTPRTWVDGGVVTPTDAGPNCGSGRDTSFPGTTTDGDMDPPISGGTLVVTHAGRFAVASEPDQDAVYIVDRVARTSQVVMLNAHDEPGRLVEDNDGIVHVVLRRGGAVVRIDPATATILSRDEVCEAPRGIALAPDGTLRVACMDGRLLSMPAAGGASTASRFIMRDLRDVAFDDAGAVYLSSFRKLQVLYAASEDGPFTTIEPRSEVSAGRVGWRLVARPGNGFVLLHQFASTMSVDISDCSAYGGMQPVVQTAMTMFPAPSGRTDILVDQAPLAVDIATSRDGSQVAIAVPGNGLRTDSSAVAIDVVRYARNSTLGYERQPDQDVQGQAIAVAFSPEGHVLVQTRAPATLIEDGAEPIALGAPRSPGLGHTIFHTPTPAGLACASCHPEGNDDGHVWTFAGMGQRRTQTFRGGFLATAPFHWDGAEHDMAELVGDVYVHRMGGGTLGVRSQEALSAWLDQLPALPHVAVEDPTAVERGRILFENPAVACATCHTGTTLTNNATVDVGTGGALQVPSLRGLRWRAPYMHTGCAATLADRFDPACGGGEAHGHTAGLSDAQRSDLIAYLESL